MKMHQLGYFIIVSTSILVSCSKNSPTGIPTASVSVPSPAHAMEYVEICNRGKDCKKFSRLVMGTDHLVQADWTGQGEPELTEPESFTVLDEAARLGINFFDTSPIYVGGVEHRLGKWKKARTLAYPDQKLYVLSKGGFPFDLFWSKKLEEGTHSPELEANLKDRNILEDGSRELKSVPAGTYASRLFGDKEQVTRRVAEELGHTVNNLDGDIAVYLMHRDDGDVVAFDEVRRRKNDVKTIMQALAEDEVASKFGLLGWSNWRTDRIQASLKLAAQDKKLIQPVLNSPYFSLFEMSKRTIHAIGVQVTHKEMMNPNFQKGIKIMPYSPLGGFSILDKPEPKWENAKAHARKKLKEGDPYWQNVYLSIFTPANEARWNRVVTFTDDFNKQHGTQYTVDQMLNAYVLAHPRTDLLAIGAITVQQVQRTVGALALSKKLTSTDLEYLYSGKER